ncbi:MAG: glycosyltransferase family 4 protein [Bacteroidales bacterium]|nr:glycosyltransferase family 4 protein [Bacteroidales bacterium]
MNILMISHYAGAPQYGMEFRSYYMAREWVRMGHNVTVVGAAFSHLRKAQPPVGHEILEGINYLWLPTTEYEGNGMKRVLTMFQFCLQVYKHSKELIAFKPDMVIASSVYTFDLYPCRYIARHTGAKLVYEVHDLWPLSVMVIGGYKKWHPFIVMLQHCENYAYKHCDMVVSMLDKAFPHMQRHGLTESRFCCVPNGYLKEEWEDIDTIELPAEHAQLFKQLHEEGKTIVGFAGGHTQSTAMDVLIEAARLLKERSDIAYVMVGKGPQKEELIHLAEEYELTNVHFLPPVEKPCIPKVVQQFDICYEGGVHSFLHKYGTSANKMIDYMLAGKPIVKSVDEPDSEVERVGCGIQVEAENIAQVRDAIQKIADMTKEERDEMGAKGRKYAIENLEYHTLSEKFIDYVMHTKE